MYLNTGNNHDWQAEDDASALSRAQAIQNDPERLKKAQACIQDAVKAGEEALGIPTPPPVPGRRNPATIMKLNTKF